MNDILRLRLQQWYCWKNPLVEHNWVSDKEEQSSPGIFSVILSVLAALIGIQSDKNRERDFEKGRLGNYIFVGIIVVVILVFTLISIVNNILEDAAK